jgi:heme/copper-type cytochrome/quinol oxidase subunit 2
MDGNRAASIRGRHPNSSSVCLAVVLAVLFPPWAVAARWQGAERPREFAVVGRDFAYAPARIEVRQNEAVRITFTASDIAHGFAIDEYRIAKRAAAGQTIVLEFRADRPGRFRIYCNLTADDRCRQMVGELLVQPGSFSK